MTQQKQNEQPLHVTIAVGNWKNYRVFRTCEALHKYVQSIYNKGYKIYITDRSGSICSLPTSISDWEEIICYKIFSSKIALKKTGKKDIYIFETKKPGLSAPIAIPEDGYRNWTLVEEDVTHDKTKYKRFQSHKDALYAFVMRLNELEEAGYYRKSYNPNGKPSEWIGEYITPMENRETIKLMIV